MVLPPTTKGHPMFGRKRKAQASTTAQATAQPTAWEVWYKDSIGRWTFGSKHTNSTDARRAKDAFTLAQAEIREIY